ncbi:tetratricopeptide repeat protein [Pseudomonas protegens]|uniref:tetratricopeptide repeat protein n=1 Tax=Pseudomonas protegens TaxID=380021 RepID=UPI0022642151|nr:tetratricopeptide repeat protein [Pseudomonas protegens]
MKFLIYVAAIIFLPALQAADEFSELPAEIKITISEKGYLSAKPALKEYINSNPESYSGYSALGKAAALEGNYKQSINYLEQAKKIKENENIQDASIYNSLGWVKFLNGDTQGAIDYIETAVKEKNNLDPKVAEAALNNLGLIYMYNNENEKAISIFDKAISDYDSKYARDNLVLINNLKNSRERKANEVRANNYEFK